MGPQASGARRSLKRGACHRGAWKDEVRRLLRRIEGTKVGLIRLKNIRRHNRRASIEPCWGRQRDRSEWPRMTKPPIWLDANILINIEKGKMPGAEAEIARLRADGHEVVITKNVEREFLHGQGMKPADTVRAQGVLRRMGIGVDTMANQVPMNQLRAWRDAGTANGLSIPDADVVAQVRAGAQARGVRNPIFMTRDAGGTLLAMRRNGVMAVEFKVQAPAPVHMSTPKPAPTPPPTTPVVRPRVNVLKAGIQGAFSAPSLASLVPDLILAIADKVAVLAAIRRIQIKFLKEGFSKGVAAGVMSWTEHEVEMNLKSRVTPFRIENLGDAAGRLKFSQIFKLAEGTENYAVDVGFQFSRTKPMDWKREMQDKGFSLLVEYGYYFGDDPEALFEYEFIDKLAWALRPTTNALGELAIRAAIGFV